MALATYHTWPSLLSQFQQELSKAFERSSGMTENDSSNIATSQWVPAVDIKEEPDRFVIVADIPGVDPKDTQVTMEHGVLTIRGERDVKKEEKSDNYVRVERARGIFYRRFSLPDTADSENISARARNGVLNIIIPKTQKAQSRKIDIRIEDKDEEKNQDGKSRIGK